MKNTEDKYSCTDLCLWVDQADSLLVDRDEQKLRVVRIRCLLHLEEGGSKGRPPVDHLQESDLGLFCRHARVLVVRLHYLPLPVLARLGLDNVAGHQFPQHLRQGGQLLLALSKLDPVYESTQQGRLLPGALVVASQKFRQLLVEMEYDVCVSIFPGNCVRPKLLHEEDLVGELGCCTCMTACQKTICEPSKL